MRRGGEQIAALRNEIEASLQRLEKETLIARNGDDFFFLTNEERDVSREIKEISLTGADEARELAKLVFDEVLGGRSGRPHWGKLYSTSALALAARYPRFDDFRRLAERMDPARKFRNRMLDALLDS